MMAQVYYCVRCCRRFMSAWSAPSEHFDLTFIAQLVEKQHARSITWRTTASISIVRGQRNTAFCTNLSHRLRIPSCEVYHFRSLQQCMSPRPTPHELRLTSPSISNSPFLQRFLWSNAGFNKLRDHPELHGIEPRYDPTVIKSTRTVTPPPSLEECISSFSAEDWTSKQPPKQTYWSTLDYHEAYKTGRLTPTKVVETLLPLIRRDVEGAEHSVSFLSTKVELVRKAAEESTARYAAGKWRGVLDGVPMVCSSPFLLLERCAPCTSIQPADGWEHRLLRTKKILPAIRRVWARNSITALLTPMQRVSVFSNGSTLALFALARLRCMN